MSKNKFVIDDDETAVKKVSLLRSGGDVRVVIDGYYVVGFRNGSDEIIRYPGGAEAGFRSVHGEKCAFEGE